MTPMSSTLASSGMRALTWRRTGGWLALAALVVVADQLAKAAIRDRFTFGERLAVLPFFDLTLLYNKGAAFSFLAGAGGWQRGVFTTVGIVAAIVITRLIAKHGTRTLFSTALALILGGALGNVIDRVASGHVTDFLLFYWRDWYWPAFNVADSAIVVGAGLLVVEEWWRARHAPRA